MKSALDLWAFVVNYRGPPILIRYCDGMAGRLKLDDMLLDGSQPLRMQVTAERWVPCSPCCRIISSVMRLQGLEAGQHAAGHIEAAAREDLRLRLRQGLPAGGGHAD